MTGVTYEWKGIKFLGCKMGCVCKECPSLLTTPENLKDHLKNVHKPDSMPGLAALKEFFEEILKDLHLPTFQQVKEKSLAPVEQLPFLEVEDGEQCVNCGYAAKVRSSKSRAMEQH